MQCAELFQEMFAKLITLNLNFRKKYIKMICMKMSFISKSNEVITQTFEHANEKVVMYKKLYQIFKTGKETFLKKQ